MLHEKAEAAAREPKLQLRLGSRSATTWPQQQQRRRLLLLHWMVVGDSYRLLQRRLAVGGPAVSSSRRSQAMGTQK